MAKRGEKDLSAAWRFDVVVSGALAAERTVQPSLTFEPIVSPGVVGLTRLRLLDDVRALHPELAIPPEFTSLLDGIIMAESRGLPPLGTLTSHNILAFCTDNRAVLARAAASETLLSFLDQAPATGFDTPLTSVFQHQMFAAEFFREATSETPPKPSA